MGIILCDVHGRAAKILVCSHIQSYIREKTGRKNLLRFSDLREEENITIISSELLLFPDHSAAYCSKCAERGKLPTGARLLKTRFLLRRKALVYLRRMHTYECLTCFYKEIFQFDYKGNDPLPFINQTTQIVWTDRKHYSSVNNKLS